MFVSWIFIQGISLFFLLQFFYFFVRILDASIKWPNPIALNNQKIKIACFMLLHHWFIYIIRVRILVVVFSFCRLSSLFSCVDSWYSQSISTAISSHFFCLQFSFIISFVLQGFYVVQLLVFFFFFL